MFTAGASCVASLRATQGVTSHWVGGGVSHGVTRGRFLGWRKKFYHWVQCQILTLTSKMDHASPM